MKILYIKALYKFSLVISELCMAVSSGLSLSSHSYGSRSTWTLSWPLVIGLAGFRFPDERRHGRRCSAIPTAIGTSPSATGSSSTAPCRTSTSTPSPSRASRGSPRNGCRRSCWPAPTTSPAGAAWWRWAPRRLPSPLLCCCACCCATSSRSGDPMFTGVAIVMTAPHMLARPHALAMPFMMLWVAGLVRAVEERRAPKPLAAALHAVVGQPAWRLHVRPDDRRCLWRWKRCSPRAMAASARRCSSAG